MIIYATRRLPNRPKILNFPRKAHQSKICRTCRKQDTSACAAMLCSNFITNRQLAVLKVVAWYQTRSSILSSNLCLPPTIILKSQDCKNVTFGKTQLFRNSGLIHVECTSLVMLASSSSKWLQFCLPKFRIGRPSLLNCRTSATLLLRCLDAPAGCCPFWLPYWLIGLAVPDVVGRRPLLPCEP